MSYFVLFLEPLSFYHIFQKKYRHYIKFVVLCNSQRRMMPIQTHIFFLLYIINLFITFYSIYTFFEVYMFQNLQGYKLNKKQKTWSSK